MGSKYGLRLVALKAKFDQQIDNKCMYDGNYVE